MKKTNYNNVFKDGVTYFTKNLVPGQQVYGEKLVEGVKLKNLVTGEFSDFKTDGVFVAIGHIPNTKFLEGKLTLDEKGYLNADKFMHTNVKGIFVAGDVQDTRFRQAISAAGSGCMAAMEVEKFLSELE